MKVWPEMEARKDTGPVARAYPRATHNGIVLSVKAWYAEIVVVGVYLEARERAEAILAPLPRISAHVINPKFVRLFLSNWMRLSSGIIFKSPHSIQIIAPSVGIFF